MIARAVVALGGGLLTPQDIAAGKLAECETVEISGTPADDWETAKATVEIPAGGKIHHWFRDE